MKWSWKIGRFAGIDVYAHATFFLLIGWLILSHWLRGGDLAATIEGGAFVLAIFGCVVLHEYGHALTARRYGIRTREITLLPMGGVARLERMPDNPRHELWVALAGPAVNVVIAMALFIWLEAQSRLEPLERLTVASGPFLQRLLIANLFLVAFNMLPAFPMDGGRVLRALLARRMDYTRATQAAAVLGQAVAFLLGFVGLFSNPFLVFIALFVWIGAAQESAMVQMRSALGGIPVARAMITEFRTLAPNDPLQRVIDLVLSGWQHDFPVLADGRLVGVLDRKRLIAALSAKGQTATVAEAMQTDVEPVDSAEMLDTALPRLQGGEMGAIPAVHNGELVGLLTTENLGEFLAIQAALKGAGRGDRAATWGPASA